MASPSPGRKKFIACLIVHDNVLVLHSGLLIKQLSTETMQKKVLTSDLKVRGTETVQRRICLLK